MALTSTPLSEPTVLQALVDRVPRLLAADFLDQSGLDLDAYPTALLSSLRAALEQGERVKFVAYLSCVDKGLRDTCSHLTDKTSNPLDSLRHHVKCSALKVVMRELKRTRLMAPMSMKGLAVGAAQIAAAAAAYSHRRHRGRGLPAGRGPEANLLLSLFSQCHAARLACLKQLFERVTDDDDSLFPLLSEPNPWLAPQLICSVNDPVARRWRELGLQAMREPTNAEHNSLNLAVWIGQYARQSSFSDTDSARTERLAHTQDLVARGIARRKVLADVLFGGTDEDDVLFLAQWGEDIPDEE